MDQRDLIRKRALERLSLLQDKFANYAPPEIIHWFYLNELLSMGIERFFEAHGLQPIDECAADEGKVLAEGSELTIFERDCIEYLSQEISSREEADRRRGRIGIVVPMRSNC